MNHVYVLGARDGSGNLGDQIATEFASMDGDWQPTSDSGEHPPGSDRYDIPDSPLLRRSDAFIITSGLALIKPITEMTDQDVDRVVSANLTYPLAAIQRWLRARRDEGGTCVVIGSYGHDHVLSNSVPYCAAKAGLDMAIRALAWDHRERDYRFHIVHPHHVLGTPMAEYVEQAVMDTKGLDSSDAMRYALKDLGDWPPLDPGDVARVVYRIVNNGPADAWNYVPQIKMYGPVR